MPPQLHRLALASTSVVLRLHYNTLSLLLTVCLLMCAAGLLMLPATTLLSLPTLQAGGEQQQGSSDTSAQACAWNLAIVDVSAREPHWSRQHLHLLYSAVNTPLLRDCNAQS